MRFTESRPPVLELEEWPCGHPRLAWAVTDLTRGTLECPTCWEVGHGTSNRTWAGLLVGLFLGVALVLGVQIAAAASTEGNPTTVPTTYGYPPSATLGP